MKNFIPKPYNKTPVTLRIDNDKLELIDALSRQYGVSRSEFINRCIDFSIENMETKDAPN